MARLDVAERTVARLRLEEDGSLSNKKVEIYALMRAEEVVSKTAAWTIVMSSRGKNLPSGLYQANIHKSPAFKRRLEALMAEKESLQDTPWGQLEWQARQVYRRAAALGDIRHMHAANEMLLKLLSRKDPPPPKDKSEPEDGDGVKRGRGAPPVPAPDPAEVEDDYLSRRLLDK